MVRLANILQILAVAVFLAAPYGLSWLGISGGRLAVENRPLAPVPPLAEVVAAAVRRNRKMGRN